MLGRWDREKAGVICGRTSHKALLLCTDGRISQQVGLAIREPSSLRLSPRDTRLKTGLEALAELELEQQITSGYHFNCLAFSVMVGCEQIGSAHDAQRAARQQSKEERRLTHEAIMTSAASRLRRRRPQALMECGGWVTAVQA